MHYKKTYKSKREVCVLSSMLFSGVKEASKEFPHNDSEEGGKEDKDSVVGEHVKSKGQG